MYKRQVDYYSKYLEVQRFDNSAKSSDVIGALKQIFGRHGIPEILVSDNGPQFASAEMKMFAETYGFQQVFTSPHNPRENGEAERFVRTAKNILKTCSSDPCLGLLALRSTPNPVTNRSPAEMMFGRRIRTPLPQLGRLLEPAWKYDMGQINDQLLMQKVQTKIYHDHAHRAKPLPTLKKGDRILDKISGKPAVVHSHLSDHSYALRPDQGPVIVRNRRHIRKPVRFQD